MIRTLYDGGEWKIATRNDKVHAIKNGARRLAGYAKRVFEKRSGRRFKPSYILTDMYVI